MALSLQPTLSFALKVAAVERSHHTTKPPMWQILKLRHYMYICLDRLSLALTLKMWMTGLIKGTWRCDFQDCFKIAKLKCLQHACSNVFCISNKFYFLILCDDKYQWQVKEWSEANYNSLPLDRNLVWRTHQVGCQFNITERKNNTHLFNLHRTLIFFTWHQAAILAINYNEMVPMLVYRTNPLGGELFSCG